MSKLSCSVRLLCSAAVLSLGGASAWAETAGLALSSTVTLQDYEGSSLPLNKAGEGYPRYYQSDTEGGVLNFGFDSSRKAVGSKSLKMTLVSGLELYAQWNPYSSGGRGFAREYVSNASSWKFNYNNRMRFWFWVPNTGAAEQNDGTTNFYMGTYVKRVTNADSSSDEAGGGHFYHPFNVMRGQWNMCTLNSHPGHERGDAGAVDSGNVPYPTSGDPANTYNYFDALTRFYIQETGGSLKTFPRDYSIDDLRFYHEGAAENDDQIYSICASLNTSNNRLFLTWNRPKDQNDVKHEVRYAFSDIHDMGWNSATAAPSGVISPPGYQGYNGMVYDTTGINVSGKSVLYLAIKPQNSSTFSQIAFPLTNTPQVVPNPPTSVTVQ